MNAHDRKTIQRMKDANARDEAACCENHALAIGDHCEEMERMLEALPSPFCEGDGDTPAEAVARLSRAYRESEEEVGRLEEETEQLREALSWLCAWEPPDGQEMVAYRARCILERSTDLQSEGSNG